MCMAPRMRAHVQGLIDARRTSGVKQDDVLGRCLVEQANGDARFNDDWIRVALMSFAVGGPPQPPMVVPQALEQLLRRPDALAGAQQAARANDDAAAGRLLLRGDALRSPGAGFAARRHAIHA